MTDKQVVKDIRKYICKEKSHSVEVKWYLKDVAKVDKNNREVDIIVIGVTSGIWYSEYQSQNKDDRGVKLNPLRYTLLIALIGSISAIASLIIYFIKK